MIQQDHFVGAVAIGLGAVLVLVAAFNWEWCFQLRKAQWFESRLGRGGARAIYAVLGLGLIGLGLAIAAGFAPNASRTKSGQRMRQGLRTYGMATEHARERALR